MDKYKQDLVKEYLTPLVGSLVFIGKTTNDTNQLRRNVLKSRVQTKIKQVTKNVPAKSELLFCYREKRKQAEQLQELQELNSVNCVSKKCFKRFSFE